MQHGAGASPFPKHFNGKRFFNPDAPQARGLLDVVRWKLTSRPEKSPKFLSDVEPSTPPARVEGSGLRTTLVNHSTVLLQQRGCNILTDPIWSERASPVSWIGPRRRRKPGVSWENLPCIDTVLISHNHYDHLDLPTLRKLAARGDSTFVVPAGGSRLLRAENIGPAHELNWGESLTLAGVTIHCVPALHFSSRGVYDRNFTLWCGYLIECGERLIYFAGDTAFGPHFAQIREKFGSPHLALLPIGAYEPRWFMSPVHMAPEEAIRAHEILAAKTSIAIHHGTFQLADEGIDTPQKQLLAYTQGQVYTRPQGYAPSHAYVRPESYDQPPACDQPEFYNQPESYAQPVAPARPEPAPFAAPARPESSPLAAPAQPESSPLAAPAQPESAPLAAPALPGSAQPQSNAQHAAHAQHGSFLVLKNGEFTETP